MRPLRIHRPSLQINFFWIIVEKQTTKQIAEVPINVIARWQEGEGLYIWESCLNWGSPRQWFCFPCKLAESTIDVATNSVSGHIIAGPKGYIVYVSMYTCSVLVKEVFKESRGVECHVSTPRMALLLLLRDAVSIALTRELQLRLLSCAPWLLLVPRWNLRTKSFYCCAFIRSILLPACSHSCIPSRSGHISRPSPRDRKET